jgi:methylase of polypeptide subunit release factors
LTAVAEAAPELRCGDGSAIHVLGARLRELGYLEATWGLLRAAHGTEQALAHDDDTLLAAVRLFLLGVPLELELAAAALSPVSLDSLEQLGVLDSAGSSVRSRLTITPYDGLLVAADWHDALGAATRGSYVGGISGATVTTAALTVRVPAATALDLGTGTGVHALLAACLTDSVVATDVNPRALAYARFNALLNACGNVECRFGSYFEPVAGELFDLVVCNPPYVVSPGGGPVYRESGLQGDSLGPLVVRGSAAHLAEGGFATTMVSWGRRAEEEWWRKPEEWLEETGCDGWVFRVSTAPAVEYAADWNVALREADPAAYETRLERWLEYYDRLGYEELDVGAFVLRRRDAGRNWRRRAELSSSLFGSLGSHVRRLFDAQDRLAAVRSAKALLDEHVAVAAGPLIEFPVEQSSQTLAVVEACDGERTLREAVSVAAAKLGIGAEALADLTLPPVRELVELGRLALVGS